MQRTKQTIDTTINNTIRFWHNFSRLQESIKDIATVLIISDFFVNNYELKPKNKPPLYMSQLQSIDYTNKRDDKFERYVTNQIYKNRGD